MYTKLALLLLIGSITTNCATIFTGSRDPILFTSEPAGATVTIDGYESGQTPVLLDVKRNLGQRWVQMELQGFETENFRLDKKFNLVALVNLTCLTCWAVDIATGSVSKFKDRNVAVALEPSLESSDDGGRKLP